MRPKKIIPLFIALGLCAATLMFLHSTSGTYKACRKEIPTNKMIWENLSQQFFSSF